MTSHTDDLRYQVEGELPLTLRPRSDDPAQASVPALCDWLREHAEWVDDQLLRHGALRFSGFGADTPQAFEAIARSIDDELGNEYLGTSPRDGLTDYVFSASELPDYFPIPQHCEMSFCAKPPRRVFFCCFEEPGEGSGETPLCDFRKVWRDLEPSLRNRFVESGIRIVRNYAGPGGGREGDPTMLKPWDEMFLTTDHEAVEKKCQEEGFEAIWLPNDGLRLLSTQPVYRDHPVSGERAWHNHLTTFHISTAEAELRRIAEYRPSDRHRGLHAIASKLLEDLKAQPSDERSMHCTTADGEEFPEADVEAVRDAVWRHQSVLPWRKGDVVAIDNQSVSHGRLPYEGRRQVAVCWA